MKAGRSVSIETRVWDRIANVAANDTDGDVSAAVEMLCREALAARDGKEDEKVSS